MAAAHVAILGGGMAALTAAYELARLTQPGGAPRHSIDIYTLGWRLGGKGASGRNAARSQRIEEHGLHIWFGAYANAFAVMKDVYRRVHALDPRKWPHGDLLEAFSPQYGFHLMEGRDGEWLPWAFALPPGEGTPGDALLQRSPTPRGLVKAMKQGLADFMERSISPRLTELQRLHSTSPAAVELVHVGALAQRLRELAALEVPADAALARTQSREYERIAKHLAARAERLELASASAGAIEIAGFFDDVRRALEVGAIVAGVTFAVLDSDVPAADDWDVLNAMDLREWLEPYIGGYVDSSVITASYDLFFSYVAGDPARGRIEAGSAMRAALWLLLEYEGAFMWRMNNGMGDAIFAPLYNALSSMPNVRFHFFCRVEALHLAPGGRSVAAITLRRQAVVKGGAAYRPLVEVAGADCWPHQPDFSQLADGDALRQQWPTCNFESDASQCGVLETLPVGHSKVVLGIPVGALESICRELAANPETPRWRTMLGEVRTVRTVAAQLWLDRTLAQLCDDPDAFDEAPIMTAFVNPLDTYADMTHLRDRELWQGGPKPEHLAYFCGALSDDDGGKPPADRAYEYAAGMLASPRGRAPMRWLWPAAFGKTGFDWERLCADPAKKGQDRLGEQYWTANVDGWARYVLALPGTSRHRLRANGSGYDNLVLAGDWIDNGLYFGCIEGTVIAGKQAARALGATEQEVPIVGEGTLFTKR